LKSIIESLGDDERIREVRRGLHWNVVVSRHSGLALFVLSADATKASNTRPV
jgi:hypothetical protein